MAIILPINEKELLRQLQQGNELAFEELYSHYIDVVYRKLLYLVKSDYIAEELAQDVFLKIWEKRDTIDPEKSFQAFIYRIAQNLVTDMYRRFVLDRKLQDHLVNVVNELYYSIETRYDNEESRQLLSDALETLPLQRKKVIALVKLEGRSYKEVSKILGISTSTIRDHIVKGTKTLKSYMADRDPVVVLLVAAYISRIFTQKIF